MKNGFVNIEDVLLKDGLFSGYSFRKKVENNLDGDTFVVQMKDLRESYSKIGGELTKVDSSAMAPKYLLESGDVLFIAKGSNNHALVYDLQVPKAVASSAFFVLRPDQRKVLPGYLAWSINQKAIQQFLKENLAGTYIPNINKTTVQSIQLALPDISLQRVIGELANLSLREHELIQALAQRRKALINSALNQKLTDKCHGN